MLEYVGSTEAKPTFDPVPFIHRKLYITPFAADCLSSLPWEGGRCDCVVLLCKETISTEEADEIVHVLSQGPAETICLAGPSAYVFSLQNRISDALWTSSKGGRPQLWMEPVPLATEVGPEIRERADNAVAMWHGRQEHTVIVVVGIGQEYRTLVELIRSKLAT